MISNFPFMFIAGFVLFVTGAVIGAFIYRQAVYFLAACKETREDVKRFLEAPSAHRGPEAAPTTGNQHIENNSS